MMKDRHFEQLRGSGELCEQKEGDVSGEVNVLSRFRERESTVKRRENKKLIFISCHSRLKKTSYRLRYLEESKFMNYHACI